jgi:DNA modification methylase
MKHEIEYIEVESLIPYARNSRTHSDEQVAQVAASIKEFGFTNPVLVDQDGMIIAGHGRTLAAQRLQMKEVPCLRLSHLSEAQKRAYVIADNKLALNAGWDDELLAVELRDLKDSDFDLSLTGFGDDELADLLAEALEEGLTDEDSVPEAPETPVTVPGDIWVLGDHRLMCGDSTSIDAVDKLMDGQKADMVFTDPPYGVDYDGGHATKERREKLANDDDVNMYGQPIVNAYAASTSDAPLYLWFADRFADDVISGVRAAGYEVRNWIVWNKNVAQFGAIGAQYKSKHEPCIYAFKRGKSPNWCGPTNETTIWDVSRDNKNSHHPTQKPVALCKRAVGNHRVGRVLDLFGGSGSTLIACENINKEAFLMELDPKYCDVIIKRWQEYTGKKAIHEETGKPYDEITNAADS